MDHSVPEFRHPEDFFLFLVARAQALAMEVELAPLSACAPAWDVNSEAVYRPDGGFFRVDGLVVKKAAGREVSGWKQPILTRDAGGKIAIVTADDPEFGQDFLFLVRAKAEPGNKGVTLPDGTNSRVLVSAPLQFSLTNLERHSKARRGEPDDKGNPIKPVPIADLLDDAGVSEQFWEDGVEDGGRFFEKTNRYGHLRVTDRSVADKHVIASPEVHDFAWVTRDVLAQARREAQLNFHLRATLSMLI